ncbi:5-oxoprolinase [Melanotaenia boesemani]|uniref:5-oxoprolinase n=1 Tax=Melanotaenia boesemani TaxID=1250792 RepID=UPI001C03A4FA|nr:5-oxoprolinase [Melanotaenia boesemani]XP_041823580.1 5-oxoprolinase [Melanotaenia boesemani]XP_041823581.1 5-oxoprolinase [Melanotaenia boesemani]XP_041823583.1 5-oxoprolinase [Melanotaenia boesemani]XP_041823584.1 5-oxoprolinase [Melanotaenia boesemani]XP_041823585.1 5-oxoprolinase [Melanotaenia boesemani]
MAETKGKFDFAIDRGGTFTDVFARLPDGRERVLKLLSRDPQNYKDAPTEGIRRILEEETGQVFPREQPVDTSLIGWIRMGTTVATNALLERDGERTALLVTKGFKDLLHIGTQARPKLFDLEVAVPDVLYEEVIEVDERVVLKQDDCELPGNHPKRLVTGKTWDTLEVWKELDLEKVEKDLRGVLSRGITSLAVLLLHSYTWSVHEEAVGSLACRLGFTQVSLSSEVMPMVRAVPRGYTVCADAYLTPKIHQYLKGFTSGFKGALKDVDVLFMQSDGGLTPMEQFCGSRAVLSGPAGGVVGYAITSYSQMEKKPVIGFDMGGTSTDVSRYAGQYEHVFEATTAGVTLQAPQLDINTVAAGGGSRLFFRSGMFVVGPESAGAHPGPACYRKGGPLTVTDANLALGRLLPSFFPKIFGPGENESLSSEETMKHFRHLTEEINLFLSSNQSQMGENGASNPQSSMLTSSQSKMTVEDVAMGFVRVANEAMCRPIRALTQAKGHDTSQHVLACFGGAGGQHACAIARALGMKTVFIHKYSGVLSAYGLALADVVEEVQEPCSLRYEQQSFSMLDRSVEQLTQRCHDTLCGRGFTSGQITTEVFLHLRYEGTDCALMVTTAGYPSNAESCQAGDFRRAFTKRYLKEFGFTIPDRPIMVDDIRVRGCGKSGIKSVHKPKMGQKQAKPVTMTKCYFEGGYLDTAVYLWEDLPWGLSIQGPAIIIDKNSTILVEPCCEACLTEGGDVCMTVGSDPHCALGTELNTVQLSIFSHRFMSIAEQMGRVLQRTSISTNIKERLDFSCAVFGPDGGLVSNAPHIPVHLGAMQETVQYQIRSQGNKLKEGDVILSNHPCAGGSHLPDLTVITPVFRKGVSKPVFFVASRGHHADIGGITPGSMPPHSTSLQQEGAVFISFKLVTGGVFQDEAVTEALMAPAQYPGCSGTRNLHDNLSDLRAQVAANQRGSQLVGELIDSYGLAVVQAYMGYIQSNAELAVRDMLKEFARHREQKTGSLEVKSEDFMDDGTPIRLRVQINEEEGSAVFDFSGTGTEVWGNCNAPRAITLSALIYCLRCMVGQDIPLNQGCLAPIKVIIPPGSILQPSQNAAVVGGNVLTSQRVVDVIFKAFEVCAASQGCMNNISFGSETVGYYETVAGGAGAGPGWNGRSGVHSHMTNTRITDPEILEKRYPVILEQFSLRPGSGGAGKYRGGDGVIRKLLFRKKVVLSVLTERRATCPYGLQGGEDGAAGLNHLHRADGRVLNLGAKTSISLQPGDMFCLYTPGGGGYGKEEDTSSSTPQSKRRRLNETFPERGSVFEYRIAQEGV